MTCGEFSVWQFFPNDLQERVLQGVDEKTAVDQAWRLTQSVGGRLGIITRIIIVDGGDDTCFEWITGRGVTYPRKETP